MAILTRPDGTKLFYKVEGKDTGRPPLVLIHGWYSNHEPWLHQVRYFRRRRHFLLLDRRGHGRSLPQAPDMMRQGTPPVLRGPSSPFGLMLAGDGSSKTQSLR